MLMWHTSIAMEMLCRARQQPFLRGPPPPPPTPSLQPVHERPLPHQCSVRHLLGPQDAHSAAGVCEANSNSDSWIWAPMAVLSVTF